MYFPFSANQNQQQHSFMANQFQIQDDNLFAQAAIVVPRFAVRRNQSSPGPMDSARGNLSLLLHFRIENMFHTHTQIR